MKAARHAEIAVLKTLLMHGIPFSISIDASKYGVPNDIWTVSNYVSPSTNHANTVVGYMDD